MWVFSCTQHQTSSGFCEVSRSFPSNTKSTESGQCSELLTNAICQRTGNYSFCYEFYFSFNVFPCFLKHDNFRLLLVPGHLLDLPFNSQFLFLLSDRWTSQRSKDTPHHFFLCAFALQLTPFLLPGGGSTMVSFYRGEFTKIALCAPILCTACKYERKKQAYLERDPKRSNS